MTIPFEGFEGFGHLDRMLCFARVTETFESPKGTGHFRSRDLNIQSDRNLRIPLRGLVTFGRFTFSKVVYDLTQDPGILSAGLGSGIKNK